METIKVLLIEPMEEARVVEIPNTLEAMQELVGGYITATYPWDDYVAVVANDNAIAEGLMPNRALEDYDILLGTFFICGLSRDNFASIPDDLIPKYTEKFRWPEVFMRDKEGIICLKLTDTGVIVS